jgi:uncharacterized protein
MIRRGERVGLRVKDMNNPKIRSYAGPTFFPIDLHYRVTAKFVPSDGRRAVEVPNVLGDVMATPVVGEVHFTLNGQDFVLTSFEGDAATGLSFVISDLTSKTETYPGGRFLDTDAVKNGEVTLDFNRAYSPPCSVTPYATCPLAPKENGCRSRFRWARNMIEHTSIAENMFLIAARNGGGQEPVLRLLLSCHPSYSPFQGRKIR